MTDVRAVLLTQFAALDPEDRPRFEWALNYLGNWHPRQYTAAMDYAIHGLETGTRPEHQRAIDLLDALVNTRLERGEKR